MAPARPDPPIADIGLPRTPPTPCLISSKRRTTTHSPSRRRRVVPVGLARVWPPSAEDATHYESTTAHGYQDDSAAPIARSSAGRNRRMMAGKPATVERIEDLSTRSSGEHVSRRLRRWVKPCHEPTGLPIRRPFALFADRLGWPQTLPTVKAESAGASRSVRGPPSSGSSRPSADPLAAVRIGRGRRPIAVPGRDRAVSAGSSPGTQCSRFPGSADAPRHGATGRGRPDHCGRGAGQRTPA